MICSDNFHGSFEVVLSDAHGIGMGACTAHIEVCLSER